jgi:hypothetical protein
VKMLERFSMENAKPVSTPLANHLCLSTSQCPKTVEETEDMSKVLYASAVGCLMYTLECTLRYVLGQIWLRQSVW